MRGIGLTADAPRAVHEMDEPMVTFDHEAGAFSPAPIDAYNMDIAMSRERGPLAHRELDVAALQLENGGSETPIDAWFMVAPMQPLGQTLATACPVCSYHHEGRCVWCPDDPAQATDIPECDRCEGRSPVRVPWYRRSEILVPVLTTASITILATVVSTIVLAKVGYKR